jgi:hypothetical protein
MAKKVRSEWFDRRLAFHGFSVVTVGVLSYVIYKHPLAPDNSAAARLATTMVDAWLWAFIGYTGSRVAERIGEKNGRRGEVPE